MPESISKPVKKLVVISDTAMCVEKDIQHAFGPVVKELENFTFVDEITWIGFNKPKNQSFVKISDERIKIIPLPSSGGKTFWAKLMIIWCYPLYFCTILQHIFSSEVIHVRAPSNPSVIAYFLSWFFLKKQFWFKYAGNWIGEASWFYKVQRKFLTIVPKNVKVTVNGSWPNQKRHVYSFENPCLTALEREEGKKYISEKQFPEKFNFCFIGNLDENKGIKLLIKALKNINSDKICSLHIVGGGALESWVRQEVTSLDFEVIVHGFLPKDAIKSIYKLSHFIVLPSKSEGFPKVIGEAMNYGTIPIVSDISCIGQYVKHQKNGYLIHPLTQDKLYKVINEALKLKTEEFYRIINENYQKANKFTYAYYQEILLRKVLCN
ncbi:MAG: glycosyltransferase [Flavobacteriaceae bacterium]